MLWKFIKIKKGYMQKIQLPKLRKIGEQPKVNIEGYIPSNKRKKLWKNIKY